jgi:hypothetical protein
MTFLSDFCNTSQDTQKDSCKNKKTLLLPLFSNELEWNRCTRAGLYCGGLVYFFIGVAIVSEVFMASIETIVSRTKRVFNANALQSESSSSSVAVVKWL